MLTVSSGLPFQLHMALLQRRLQSLHLPFRLLVEVRMPDTNV